MAAVRIMMMCLASTAAVLFLEILDKTAPRRDLSLPSTEVAPSVSRLPAKIEARTEAALIGEVLSQPEHNLSHFSPIELHPPFISVDVLTLRWGDQQLRFDGIDGPNATEVCLDELGHRWACGLQARVAIHNLLAGHYVICTPVASGPAQHMTATYKVTRPDMTGDGLSVERQLVRFGWARPSSASDERFGEALAEARRERAGLWRGGWTTVPSGVRDYGRRLTGSRAEIAE